ncbi:MAG: divergent polysaccharide deacetylase family protein [Alphaproteobacteria bacterium]
MPRKRRKSRVTRSNLPLLLTGLFLVAAVVLFFVVGGEEEGEGSTVDIPVIVAPAPPPDAPAEQEGDPIGDLIASLDPEPAPFPKDVPAWRRFAVAAPPDDGRPMVAIVIDDVGLNADRAADTVALPAPVTLALLPYAENLPALAAKARGAGHELLVHVPMQPGDSSVDPGPHALKLGLDEAELRKRLDWNLSRFDGYVGFNNHMGSGFTADSAGMRVVIDEAHRRGLLFLDSRTTKETKGRALAEAAGVPVIERQVFLDNDISAESIRAQLATAEKIAEEKGAALVIGHPHAVTIAVLREWLAANEDFAVVPVSTLVRRGVGGNGGDVDPAYSDSSGY